MMRMKKLKKLKMKMKVDDGDDDGYLVMKVSSHYLVKKFI